MKRVGRKKAIREKCLDCCCGQSNEVRLCETYGCPLWSYRMGREDTALYDDSDNDNDSDDNDKK